MVKKSIFTQVPIYGTCISFYATYTYKNSKGDIVPRISFTAYFTQLLITFQIESLHKTTYCIKLVDPKLYDLYRTCTVWL